MARKPQLEVESGLYQVITRRIGMGSDLQFRCHKTASVVVGQPILDFRLEDTHSILDVGVIEPPMLL